MEILEIGITCTQTDKNENGPTFSNACFFLLKFQSKGYGGGVLKKAEAWSHPW